MGCTQENMYRSVGTIRLQTNGCCSGIIFTPDSDHLAKDRGKEYAVFFSNKKGTNPPPYLLKKALKGKLFRLDTSNDSNEHIFHAALAAAKDRSKVVIVVDANCKVIQITVPAE